MKQKINIVIADDHLIFLDGLRALLKEEESINIVDLVTDGLALLQLLELQHEGIDIVVIDINMPALNGKEATKHIQTLYPKIKILVLSMHNDEEHIVELINAGAHGYILKNRGKEELVVALEALAKDKKYFGEEVTEIMMNSIGGKTQAPEKEEIMLTKREKEVLRLIGMELTSMEIAHELKIAKATVETHRRNLINKLDVRSSMGLVKYAVKHGYV